MDTHKNAPLTAKGREMMVHAVVDCGLSKAAAARQFNTPSKTVGKWIERFEVDGVEGLRDRSSRPHSSPSQASPAVCAAVEALRRQRHTGKQIAAEVGVSAATVSRILRRFGLNALRFFRSIGVKVERVMTDNGSSFRSRRYAKALRLLKIKHLRTRPYTPKTNGKAERFVQPSLREWAYARSYSTSDDRAASCPSGFTATTGIDLMAVSDQIRPSADSP
jgi:transposase